MRASGETKSERTKRNIIEKAAPLFNRKGYAGTSLNDIVSVTGLTKGAIYANFRNKDDIAFHAFNYNVEQIQKAIAAEMELTDSPLGKLRAFPGVYKRIYRKIVADGGCPIANTLMDSDDTHPGLHEKALEVIHQWEKLIKSLIKKGVRTGEIKDDVDPERVAQYTIAMLEGASVLTKATGRDSYIIHVIDNLEMVLYSLGKE